MNFKTKLKTTYIVSGIVLVFFILLGMVISALRPFICEIFGNSAGLYRWQRIILGVNLPIGLTIGIIFGLAIILKDGYCSRKLSFVLNGLAIVLILLIAFFTLVALSGPSGISTVE